MVFLKPEGAGHAATASVEQFIIQAETLQNLLFAFHAHNGFVMAMPMNDGAAFQLAPWIIVRMFYQKLA